MQTVSRLIDQFKPTHYQLSLTIDRPERRFSGTVTIEGVTSHDTVALHAKDLTIESVTVDGRSAKFTASENDELFITADHIESGNHMVVIGFSGEISDGMHGMYPCYFEHDGVKKELIATQFESHHAREVFPCVDEPEAKASFSVILTTETDVAVLGNMPIQRQQVEDGKLVTTFERSPNMSSYLLAWVVGELHKKTVCSKSGTEVSVWATPAQPAESFDFALDIAARTIDFFNDYFGIAYPLPKSDHVALPDFSSGAMENWGLITYRETTLLANPKTTSVSSKHYIATVIAHELSHQWFGNLVTMRWWNDLWLNESFATLMEYIAIDALEPDWNVWLDFASHECLAALRRDSLDGVQSVQVDVNHPDEISTLFDGAIVYAKGARLLHMLQNFIGHEAFQAGLRSYFTKFGYGNTVGDDLWRELSASSGKDIGSFMNTWISQSGFPVLHVTQNGDELTLSQNQFFTGPHQPSDKLWPLPLDSSGQNLPEIMDDKQLTLPALDDSPVRFNVSDSAHYITHYQDDTLSKLIEKVRSGKMEQPLHRLQLLHEQTMLARGGVISSASLVELLDAYQNETDESVWDVIAVAISELKKFVETDELAESKFRSLAKNLADEQYRRLGWEPAQDETETDTKLRATIIALTLYGENQAAISQAKQIFESTNLEEIDSELRSLIIGSAVRHSDRPAQLIAKLMDAHKATSSAEIQGDIASGVTSTIDSEAIESLLSTIKQADVVRTQDVAHWFIYLIRNRHSRGQAWQWLQDNWSWIEKTFGGDKSYDDFVRFPALGLSNRQQLESYVNFFAPMKSRPALSRAIELGGKEIQGRVELIEKDGEAVRSKLGQL